MVFVKSSTIDHCYTTTAHSFSSPKVSGVGDSDHLGVSVEKVIRVAPTQPKVIQKRVYSNFSPDTFCSHLVDSNVCDLVRSEPTLEEADRVLHRELL